MSDSDLKKAKKGRNRDDQKEIDAARLQPMQEAMDNALDTESSDFDPQAVEKYFGGMKKKGVSKQIERYIKQDDFDIDDLPEVVLQEIDETVIGELMSNLKSGEQDKLRSKIEQRVQKYSSGESGENVLYDDKGNPVSNKIDNAGNIDKNQRAVDYLKNGLGAAHS